MDEAADITRPFNRWIQKELGETKGGADEDKWGWGAICMESVAARDLWMAYSRVAYTAEDGTVKSTGIGCPVEESEYPRVPDGFKTNVETEERDEEKPRDNPDIRGGIHQIFPQFFYDYSTIFLQLFPARISLLLREKS
jgi:hypothetical protein